MKKIISFTVSMLFVFSVMYAQSTDSVHRTTSSILKAGVYYTSRLHYYGRTDSLQSTGFFPILELWPTSHLYFTAAPVFVNNKVQHADYAGTVVVAGYRFGQQDRSAGNVYVVKPFYTSSTQLVQSAMKAQLAFSYTRLNKLLNISAGADVKWSDKLDYGLTGGIDHIFRAKTGKNALIVIDPSATVNAGTRQFTNTYYRKSEFLLFPGPQQQVTEQVSRFKILSYEISMPAIYAWNKFQFLFTPSYVSPQNLVSVPGRPDLSEYGRSIFYFTTGMKYSF